MKKKFKKFKNYKFLNLILLGIFILFSLLLVHLKEYLFKAYSFIRGFEINEISKLFIENYLFSILFGSVVTFFILLNFDSLKTFLKRKIIKLSTRKLFFIILFLNLILSFSLFFFIDESFISDDAARYMNVARSLYNGEGFVSHTVFVMGLRPDSVPYPDLYKPPLFSIILAASYFIFGLNYFSAKIVNILLSSFIAPLTFLLAIKLSKSKNLALLSVAFVTFDWILIEFKGFVLSEFLYMFLTLLTFILLYKVKNRYHYFLIGIIIGLAYLTRYPALYLLFPSLLVYEFLRDKSVKRVFMSLSIAFLAFMIIVSPWLIRNYIHTGSPTYSYLNYFTGYTYADYSSQSLNGYNYYLTSLEKPKTIFEVLLNSPAKMINKATTNIKFMLYMTPFFIINNPFLFLLFLSGCLFLLIKKRQGFYYLLFYLALNYIFFSLSLPDSRHLYPLIPMFAIIISIGFIELYSKLSNKKLLQMLLASLIVLILSTNLFFGIFSFLSIPLESGGFIQFSKKISKELIQSIRDDESVMVNGHSPIYHYFSNKNVVQFPYYKDEKEFFDVIKDYNVRYIIHYYRFEPRVPYKIPETGQITESFYISEEGKVFEVGK